MNNKFEHEFGQCQVYCGFKWIPSGSIRVGEDPSRGKFHQDIL